MEKKSFQYMEKYNTEYKDYSEYIAIMVSTDRGIFNEKSAVRMRMLEQAKLYKELHIIIFSTNLYKKLKISENCYIYSTNSISRLTYILGAYKTGKEILIKRKNFNNNNNPILITCQDPFETGFVGKLLLNKAKKINNNSELILQIHTDLFSPYFIKHSILNKIRLNISKFTLKKSSYIRVVSNKIANSLVVRGIDKDKIIIKPIDISFDVLKNGIPNFDLHRKFSQFRKIVLIVSRLESEKNIDGAIRAFALVLKQIPDAGIIIVGSGRDMSKLKKLVYQLNIENSVIFEGWQTDIVSYYKGCDLLLVTSWYEGYGMTLKEAQVSGCKIVSTDVGIAKDVGADIVDWNYVSISEGLIRNLK